MNVYSTLSFAHNFRALLKQKYYPKNFVKRYCLLQQKRKRQILLITPYLTVKVTHVILTPM